MTWIPVSSFASEQQYSINRKKHTHAASIFQAVGDDSEMFDISWKALVGRVEDASRLRYQTLWYEVNSNIVLIQSSYYSMADFMSDIGGLIAFLTFFGMTLNGMFSYNRMENHLVAQLYEKQKIMHGKFKNESKTLNNDD